ncbi:MAG: hypothetical protein LBH58_12165 [Tannerellaceae bacterium]|jgi:hypothetical protein|nr:hypothetical protein [Tannerellaceae bacterium]
MNKKINNLERLKGGDPFKVPEGYFEDFASQMMRKLPDKTYEQPKRVTMMDRVRPWVYMAAVFAGLGLFFKVIVGFDGSSDSPDGTDFVTTQYSVPATTLTSYRAEEEEDYLEYLETQYVGYILAEELGIYE